MPQVVVAAETVAEFKRKLSNVDLSSFYDIILIVRLRMVVHKRLLTRPSTYHKLECVFHCSLLLFLALVLNFI